MNDGRRFRRKQSIDSRSLLSLVFVIGENEKEQEVVGGCNVHRASSLPNPGFLDLQCRLSEVVSILELGSTWLLPNKVHLDIYILNLVELKKLTLKTTKSCRTKIADSKNC